MSILGRLKTAIKGNPVLKEHDLGKHTCSGGPGLLWKVYDGVKKTTQQEVSVFIFSKNSPELEKLSKNHREELFEMLRKGPTVLAKLRHPKLLTLHHTVEESSDCIAFTTEPVFCSLANILGHYDNLPSPLPLSIKEFQLHTLEGHYGLLQIAEALSFLHNDVKMIHGNINPENIVITKSGDWKLAGFNFASYDNYQSTAQTSFHFKEYNSRRILSPNPHLDYLAPEYIISGCYDTRSDLYSVGMLAYSLYNGGNPLYQNNNNTRSFKHNAELISRISESSLGDTPLLLRPLVRELLAVEPSVRPDCLQIIKHGYFDDVLVSTLRYLDSLYAKSDMEKSQWFKTVLGKMVIKLPKRVVHQRVIPQLVSEFRNHKMIPFVLPIILLIADDCTMREYSDLILPILIPVFKIHDPIQIPLIILQKMDLILKKTSPDEMKQYILPMILATLESDNSQVQELCVSILPTFAEMIDYSSMKHSIIPRLTTLSVSSSTVSLSVKCLVTLGQIVDTLDKTIILEQVLPVIVKIPSREPGVLMGILGIFHKAMTSKNIGFSKELIAQRVLPYLIPLSIQTTLNKKQFDQFMMVIKELLKKMESDHTLYLDQVAKMEEQTKSTVEFAKEVSQYKASEDALKGIANMSGQDTGEGLITSRMGGTHKGGMASGQQQPRTSNNTSTVDDMFSGLDVSESGDSLSKAMPTMSTNRTTPTMSNNRGTPTMSTNRAMPTMSNSRGTVSDSTKATPTMSQMRRIDFSDTGNQLSHSKPPPLGTWDVPNNAPLTNSNSSTKQQSVGQMGRADILSVNESSNSEMVTRPMSTGMSDWPSGISELPGGVLLEPNPAGMGAGILKPATGWSSDISESSSGMGTSNMGTGPSNMGTGPSNMGTGPSNMGTGPSNMGMGSSNMGMRSSNMGMGSSNMGTGSSNMGMGSSNMVMGSSNMVMGSSNMGMGSSNMGMGSSSNMGTNSSSWSNDISSGMGTGSRMEASNMGTGILQPNSISGTGILQPSSSGFSSGTESSNMGMGWSSGISSGTGSSNMGTGILQPSSASGWSNSISDSSSGMGGSSGMGMSSSGMGSSKMGMGSSGMGSSGMGSSGMGIGSSGMGSSGTGMSSSGMGMGSSGMGSSGMRIGSSGMGSSGMGMGSSGMGMGSSGMGMGSSGMGMGSSGMGLLQPYPVSSSNTGWGTTQGSSSGQHPPHHNTVPLTTPQQTNQNTGMAPGANPFADFNSLI